MFFYYIDYFYISYRFVYNIERQNYVNFGIEYCIRKLIWDMVSSDMDDVGLHWCIDVLDGKHLVYENKFKRFLMKVKKITIFEVNESNCRDSFEMNKNAKNKNVVIRPLISKLEFN